MGTNVHSGGDISKAVMWLLGITAFVVVALTWVPDWISPEGSNGTGNRGSMEGPGVGVTTRMIEKDMNIHK